MKNKYILPIISLLIITSCEDVEVAYPGNNQTTSPVSPNGTAEWIIDSNDGIGQLPENSAAGLDLATLNGINSDLLTAICQKKDKRRSLKKMAIEYFKTK